MLWTYSCNAMFLTFDVADTLVNGSIIGKKYQFIYRLHYAKYSPFSLFFGFHGVSAIFVLRTWAIYEKNTLVLISLGILGLARFAIGIVSHIDPYT